MSEVTSQVVVQHPCLEEIDFLAGIPRGGDRIAEGVSERLSEKRKIPVVHFVKTGGNNGAGQFEPQHKRDYEILSQSRVGCIFDDVGTVLSSLARMLLTHQLKGKKLDFYGLFMRGESETTYDVRIPTHFVLEEHIPNIITPSSPYWKYIDQPKLV